MSYSRDFWRTWTMTSKATHLWQTRDGRRMRMSEMADEHLESAWGHLEQRLVASSLRRQTPGRRIVQRLWAKRQRWLQIEMDARRRARVLASPGG